MSNLSDRQSQIIEQLANKFGDMVAFATEPVDSSATPGKAAYNSAVLDNISRNIIKLVEDLLQITRQMRELWIVGPLRLVGEGEREGRENMDQIANGILQQLNVLRDRARQRMVAESNGALEYESALANAAAHGGPAQPGAPAGQPLGPS